MARCARPSTRALEMEGLGLAVEPANGQAKCQVDCSGNVLRKTGSIRDLAARRAGTGTDLGVQHSLAPHFQIIQVALV